MVHPQKKIMDQKSEILKIFEILTSVEQEKMKIPTLNWYMQRNMEWFYFKL